MEPTQERWLPVVGYEGLYEVSDQGRVRSLPRRVPGRWPSGHPVPGRILRQTTKGPYLALCLSRGGVLSKHTPVQRLVARAFLGPRPEGMVLRHLNGEGHDNRLSNLIYGTPSENNRDTVAHGHHWLAKRDACKHGHLYTPENTDIRYRNGWTCRVCRTCVTNRTKARSNSWQPNVSPSEVA